MSDEEIRVWAKSHAPEMPQARWVPDALARLTFHQRQDEAVLAATGLVTHATDEECVGCGCRSLTPHEAVCVALAEKDKLIGQVCDLVRELCGIPTGHRAEVKETP
jgi:hypothetical protein